MGVVSEDDLHQTALPGEPDSATKAQNYQSPDAADEANMRPRMQRVGWICALLLLLVLPGTSQTTPEDRIRALEEQVEALTRLVNLQQERLEAVESRAQRHPEVQTEPKRSEQPPSGPARQGELLAAMAPGADAVEPPLQDQTTSSDASEPAAVITPEPPVLVTSAVFEERGTMDLSGYYDGRFFDDSRSSSHSRFQQHALSLFFGKTLGNWTFHSEVEYEYAFKFDGDGKELSELRGELNLETAWVNYTHSDSLQARTGYILFPTYWRVHHYPSLALTVNNPLIDKRIFPSAFTGIMTHGSQYIGDGGVTYAVMMGNGRGPDLGRSDVNDHKATGEKLLVHLPSENFFNVLDFGILLYQDKHENRDRESVYGFETRIEKGDLGSWVNSPMPISTRITGLVNSFAEGFYLQPWVRVARRFHVVYRYDTLNFDNRISHSRDLSRHTFGLNFRPRPQVSLKLEFNRDSPESAFRPAFSGVAAAVTLFFQ